MKHALTAKFNNNPRLKKLLEMTKDAELIETSPYDKFWGAGETKQLTFLLTNMLRCDKIYL